MLTCKLCRKTFDGIPSDAVPVSQRRQGGYQLFQFKNGELHDLHEVRAPVLTQQQLIERGQRGAHSRYHTNKGSKREGCKYCFPGTAQAEEKKL